MSTQIQRRRGTTAEHSTFTGVEGELTVDTTKDTVVVHDGATTGGRPLLREDQNNLPTSVTNGISVPSTNTVALSTNGTERLRITATGTLLLNTAGSTPGNINALLAYGDTDAGIVYLQRQTGTDQVRFYVGGNRLGYLNTANSAVTLGTANYPLIFNTNDAERLRITSAGLVGIGTSVPDSTLELKSGPPSFKLSRNTAASTGNDFGRILFGNSAGTTLGSIRGYSENADTHLGLKFSTGTSDTIALTIDEAQRVGIGTTSPGGTLEVGAVTGAVTTGDLTVTTGSTAASVTVGRLSSTSNDNTTFLVRDRANNTILYASAVGDPFRVGRNGSEFARLDTSGRLLVGTSSARSNFFAGVGTPSPVQLELGSDAASLSCVTGRNTATSGGSIILGHHRSGTVGGNGAVSNGDLIGSVSFQGADGTNLVESAAIAAYVDGTPGTNDMPGRLVFSTTADGASSPTEAMRIDKNQDIYASSSILVSTPNRGVYIGGSAATRRISDTSIGSSATTLYIGNSAIQVSSDVRLKENIEDTKLDALDAISRINVKDFTWNDPTDTSFNNRNARGKWTGLIAQELVNVLPFVVNAPRKEADGSIDYDSADRWTLDQSQLCPVLIKAVQQQQEIIAALEARLTALESA